MDTSPAKKPVLITAWLVILVFASFKIILQEIFNYPVTQVIQFGLPAIIAAILFFLTFIIKPINPLRQFFALFIVLAGAQWLVYTKIDTLPFFHSRLQNPSFNVYMLAEQSLNFMVTLIIILFLFVLKKDRKKFFLAVGNFKANVQPIKWLWTKKGTGWHRFGSILAICLSLGTFVFLFIAARPSLNVIGKILPFVPMILLAATLNAFNEEMTYKASFLSVLENVVGKQQALYLMAAYFGILHFYGVPYGIIGVLMAAFLGWLLGKSMLETRGMFWAWFIHFWQDVLIFAFLAIGSIRPGG